MMLSFSFKETDFFPHAQLSTLPPQPVIPSKKPFKVELLGGKRYSWCTCGHSKKQVKTPSTSPPLYKYKKALSLTSPLPFSPSAMAPTSSMPKACPRCDSSQRKTPQSGCVDASTQATHLTVMVHTSRTSSHLLHCMKQLTLKQEGRLSNGLVALRGDKLQC